MNVRESVLNVLLDMESNGTLSHIALQNELQRRPEMSLPDRRFLRCVIRGTLENRYLLDDRINRKSKVKVNKMKPVIRQVLRLSAYQLFFMDRVPAAAVCNEAVKLVQKHHLQGLKGFVNGVLRSMAREESWPEVSESVRYSVPQWILDLWDREYGSEAKEKMLLDLTKDKPACFRIRRELASKEDILDSLRRDGAVFTEAPFPKDAYMFSAVDSLEQLEAFAKGWIQIQDLSSMLVGAMSDVKPGMKVLDVCAAPGGKSMHVAELMKGTGLVTSCDLTEYKVRLIRENVKRAGLDNLCPVVQDARSFRPEWEETMDIVIADLPCSGLGVLGRKPDIRYRVSQDDPVTLAELQRTILSNVIRYVKPGGLLLYSTCTIAPEENRLNREWILSNLPVASEEWREEVIPAGLLQRAKGGQLQILPGVDPCDGFYLARFRKK